MPTREDSGTMLGRPRDVVVDTSGADYRRAVRVAARLSLAQLSSRAQALAPKKTEGTAARDEIIELAAVAAEYCRRRP